MAILATYLCRRYDVTAGFPLTLIGTAIVFPLVFSIGGALKSYFATRDWIDGSDETLQHGMRDLLSDLLKACMSGSVDRIRTKDSNGETG